MATANQPFKELNSALENLFRNYHELQGALESLRANALNLALDARDQALKIRFLGSMARHNLSTYLGSLQEMTKAMREKDFKKCETRANRARSAMKKGLHPEVGSKNADEMLKAVERVVEILREREQTDEKQSAADIDEVIQKATTGASSIIKDATLGLLHNIKEEMKKALDDRTFFINSSALEEGVQNVKQTIEKTNSSYSENISALDKIISVINELSRKEEDATTLSSLEANAKILGETCETKLRSIRESKDK